MKTPHSRMGAIVFFSECVAKGSRLTWESEGRAVFARRCFRVRNRSRMFATVLNCSNPLPMALPLGRALKSDLSWMRHVSCQFAPLFHCDLHESGMSCKKGDAFRCTGAGFRESDTFAS